MRTFAITLSERDSRRFDLLQRKTEADTPQEVFANALKLYDGLISEAEKQAKFYRQYGAGPIEPFDIFVPVDAPAG